jgi:hypothetical protein
MNLFRSVFDLFVVHPSSRPRAFAVAVLVMSVALSGCVPNQALRSAGTLPKGVKPSVVLLIKPDVQLSVLTAGGLQEPNAAWTAAGQAHVEQALAELMRKKNAALIPYREPDDDPQKLYSHNQVIKMHSAVGAAILMHKYTPVFALPTKAERFDWTLGTDVRQLKDEFAADYALFVYMRDSYASSGRVAVIVIGALFGAAVSGGIQVGFSSLVDLRTGEVVWFNRLVSGSGDLRTPEPARVAVETLLTDLPL